MGQERDRSGTEGERLTLKEALASLEAKTLASKVRQLMPDIEEKLASGVSQQAIVDTLNEHGLNLSLATFRTYLKRWRSRGKSRPGRPGREMEAPATGGTKPPLNARPAVTPADASSQHVEQFQSKGDIARAREKDDIDLNALAKLGKRTTRRSEQ